MRLAAVVALAAMALGAGCLRTTTFRCAGDDACGGGTCEPVGFCSFPDDTCAAGRRFGAHAEQHSGQCVGEGPGDDAGVDASPDGAPDALAGCPADYAPTTGGEAGHRYKARTVTATWDDHRTACAGEGGYLGIPGNALELQAMLGLVGAAIFVGISDQATENTWVDVRGAPATFLPWAGGQPDDANPGEDCVRASGTTFSDERCSRTSRAVCECVE